MRLRSAEYLERGYRLDGRCQTAGDRANANPTWERVQRGALFRIRPVTMKYGQTPGVPTRDPKWADANH
jgi:hypothetical protein